MLYHPLHQQQHRCLRAWRRFNAMASQDAQGLYAKKQELRKTIKQRLKGLAPEAMLQQSQDIADRVIQLPVFQSSINIGIYITCERLREVDTSAILAAALQQGKHCFVPLVQDGPSDMRLLHIDSLQDLHPAPPFGILEPRSSRPDGSARDDALSGPGLLDLLVMPGLGFDTSGGRLGRGGGYYDKFVGELVARAEQLGRPAPLLLALAFREQLVEQVPMGQLDQPVDVLVLPDSSLSNTSKWKGNECGST